jgi:hypothetical protein
MRSIQATYQASQVTQRRHSHQNRPFRSANKHTTSAEPLACLRDEEHTSRETTARAATQAMTCETEFSEDLLNSCGSKPYSERSSLKCVLRPSTFSAAPSLPTWWEVCKVAGTRKDGGYSSARVFKAALTCSLQQCRGRNPSHRASTRAPSCPRQRHQGTPRQPATRLTCNAQTHQVHCTTHQLNHTASPRSPRVSAPLST